MCNFKITFSPFIFCFFTFSTSLRISICHFDINRLGTLYIGNILAELGEPQFLVSRQRQRDNVIKLQ